MIVTDLIDQVGGVKLNVLYEEFASYGATVVGPKQVIPENTVYEFGYVLALNTTKTASTRPLGASTNWSLRTMPPEWERS